jgi:hypothetical protein
VRWNVILALVAVPIFLVLARWNGAVAVLFGIAVLAWELAELYRWSQGGDMFSDDERRR